MSDPVSFTFTRTKRDDFDAIWLNALRSPYYWGLLVASPIINGTITWFGAKDDPVEVVLGAIALVAFVSIALVFGALALCYYLAARAAWRSPGALQPISFEFSDAGRKASSEVGAGESVWAVFDAVYETAKILVIRQLPGLLLILPKRNADEGALARLRVLLRTHIPKTQLMESRA